MNPTLLASPPSAAAAPDLATDAGSETELVPFAIRVGTRTLFVVGDLDLATRGHLLDAVPTLLCHVLGADAAAGRRSATDRTTDPQGAAAEAGTDCGTALLDATDLWFVDAAGMAGLVMVSAALARAGVTLRIVHPSSQLRRVSRICDLDALLGLNPPDGGPRPAALAPVSTAPPSSGSGTPEGARVPTALRPGLTT